MKKHMTPCAILVTLVLTLTVALLPATANTTNNAANTTNNATYYAEPFEVYTNGTLIVGTNGWYAEDLGAATVMYMVYTNDYRGGGYPIAFDPDENPREKALWIENNITNRFDGTVTGVTNWIDHVIKPTFWDEDEYPPFPDDALMAYFFNTNGNLVVRNIESYGGNVFSNTWVTIDTETARINTNDWIRMTVAVDFTSGGGGFAGFFNRRYYRIWLNGSPIRSEAGYRNAADDPHDTDQRPPILNADTAENGVDRDTVRNGYWFQTGPETGGQRKSALSEIAINGTGWLDDLLVQTLSPFTTANITASISHPGFGSITPSGVIVVEIGGSTNFIVTVTEEADYHISDVLVGNGVPETPATFTGPTNTFEYTFENVAGNRSIHAVISPDTVGTGVPIWWLRSIGVTNDFEAALSGRFYASKPLTIGEEYWVSTDPGDPDSLFQIATIGITNNVANGITNEVPYVRWASPTFDPDLDPFRIYRSINVADTNTWTLERSEPRQAAENIWIDESAPTNAVFYQIRVNSAP